MMNDSQRKRYLKEAAMTAGYRLYQAVFTRNSAGHKYAVYGTKFSDMTMHKMGLWIREYMEDRSLSKYIFVGSEDDQEAAYKLFASRVIREAKNTMRQLARKNPVEMAMLVQTLKKGNVLLKKGDEVDRVSLRFLEDAGWIDIDSNGPNKVYVGLSKKALDTLATTASKT